ASICVMVVDDDVTTTNVLQGILQSAGFATVCASDAAGAMKRLDNDRPSLILLDVHLPDGDGIELCRRIKTCPATVGVPILFISANDDVDVKVRGFEAGGVDYITKPLVGAEVIARVTTHLRLRQAYDRLAELHGERLRCLGTSQQSLMPRPEELPEASFGVSLRQVLQAGGDFYDVVQAGGTITDYLVADTSGHDLGASLWTASLKALMAEYASPLNSPAQIFGTINKALLKIMPAGMYFTAIYARLNRRSRKLTLVNAGHPPACHSPADGADSTILWQEGDVLGAFPDATFGVLEIPVRRGDRIFLYSDGLVESGGTRTQGIERLPSACQANRHLPLREIAGEMIESLCLNAEPKDDLLLLVIEV
ncbi:MAG: fused response regulator/phosphatase, partial [Candidatus Hydrogenedentes bacterium]|nr:fused response regulator/phosphatase [Candidatus Hydrogenedentota bacterium]